MKKAILISIQPQWVEKILNGEKTIEIRKSMPKCELPIDVYIYCTKGNTYLVKAENYEPNGPLFDYVTKYSDEYEELTMTILNGKVVAKFTLNKVDYTTTVVKYGKNYTHEKFEKDIKNYVRLEQILEQTCLTEEELINYELTNHKFGLFAWHIDNLEIFNVPRDLSGFRYNCIKGEKNKCDGCDHYYCNCNESIGKEEECLCDCMPNVKRPPQSWQYVYVEV